MRLLAVLLCAAAGGWAQDAWLLRGVTVHPVTSASMENVSLLVKDGLIAEIGPKIAAPKGVKVIEARGLHVYPGFIDSATEIGLSEIGAIRETNDVAEIGDFKPQLRSAVAVNPSTEHIPVIRANGITAAMAVPAGGIISGQAALMRLDGWTWEEMAVARSAAMVLHFPALTTAVAGGPPQSYTQAKLNLDARLKQLDEYFDAARRYQKAKPQIDLGLEAMLPVLEQKLPLLVPAVREREIRQVVDWAEKQHVRIVLWGVRKPGAMLAVLKAKKIPVILGPTLALPLEEDDAYDAPFTLPGELYRAGVKFAFGTGGNQFSRNLPYQAAQAVAFGLPREEALKSITIHPAEIWGVQATLGSLEPGKAADFQVTDGDPLEVRTQVKRLFIRGREVDLESKHTILYRKYLARP